MDKWSQQSQKALSNAINCRLTTVNKNKGSLGKVCLEAIASIFLFESDFNFFLRFVVFLDK
jgi:hypothetical protein